MRMKYWIGVLGFVLISLTMVACPNDGCEPEEMRCHRDRVQICNAGQNWETVVNCRDLEEEDGSGDFECIDPLDGDDTEALEDDTDEPVPTCEEVMP
jgi:hypothetical protein